jgi:hypothetical protein
MDGAPALLILPFSPQGASGGRQALLLRDGILLRCNRDDVAKR